MRMGWWMAIVVVVGCLIALVMAYYFATTYIQPDHSTHNALYVSLSYSKSYNYYSLWIPHPKLNGKSLHMLLDTGAWISFIAPTDSHKLCLDTLPQSKLVQTEFTYKGKKNIVKSVDVTMSLNGSSPFKTTVATTIGSFDPDVSLLSLHDFLKVYHGIDFRSCRFFETMNDTTWSVCPQ